MDHVRTKPGRIIWVMSQSAKTLGSFHQRTRAKNDLVGVTGLLFLTKFE